MARIPENCPNCGKKLDNEGVDEQDKRAFCSIFCVAEMHPELIPQNWRVNQ